MKACGLQGYLLAVSGPLQTLKEEDTPKADVIHGHTIAVHLHDEQ